MDTLIPTGQLAPSFSLPDLQGSVHRLEEIQGRVLVLNFWSAECPWAERADQEVLALLEQWSERVSLWTIASNVNEPVELLLSVAEQRGLPLLLHDKKHQVADLYGAQTTPHFFVLDSGGILSYQGALDDVTFRQRQPQRFYLRQAVEALLAGRFPDPAATPAYGCTIVRLA